MTKSKTTKSLSFKARFFAFLNFLLQVAPLVIYVILGLCSGCLLVEKFALCSTVLVVAIMSIVAWSSHIVLRSRVWILLLGLYFCLDYFLTPLIIIAACQVVSELAIAPLARHYRKRATINKEIDNRLN